MARFRHSQLVNLGKEASAVVGSLLALVILAVLPAIERRLLRGG
jgi:hypothetical protein